MGEVMINSIEEPNANLSENIISSDNTAIVPEETFTVSNKEIYSLLWRIPHISYTLIDAVKSSIKRNGINRKIPLNNHGEVIGNLIHFIAGKEMNILREEDFVILDVQEDKIQEHVLLDIFLTLQYDKTRLSLIAAEFYNELCEINMQARALSMRIGMNTRKEISALIGISEGYLGKALSLKRNKPSIFYFLMNSDYTYRDVQMITDIQEFNPSLFKQLENLEITLQQAWYKLDKKSKNQIEKKKDKVVQGNALTDYLDDVYLNKEYQKDLEKKDQIKMNVPAEIEKDLGVTNDNFIDDEIDPFAEIDASIELDKYNKFLKNIIDDEGSRNNFQKILTIIDKKDLPDEFEEMFGEPDYELQPLNKYKEFKHITDKMLMEISKGKKYIDVLNESVTESITKTFESDVIQNTSINQDKNDITTIRITDNSSIFKSKFDNIDEIFGDMEYLGHKVAAEERFLYPFDNISQKVWNLQNENLNKLIENGKIHQHKEVHKFIGNIILKFENQNPIVITTKNFGLVIDLLDSSVRLTTTTYNLAKKLKEHIQNLTDEERAEFDFIETKIIDFENNLQDYIIYK